MKHQARRAPPHAAVVVHSGVRRRQSVAAASAKKVLNRFFSIQFFQTASIAVSFIGFLAFSSGARGASVISLAGIDYQKLCRDTAHVPLVQAAIRPGFINVWTEQESRRAGRYEQYSFRTQRIDVRVEHDISLYHGLIHRTLDLIGESQWRHRDFEPHEDYEHWLIYHTLETHWPGVQRRQGNEPTFAVLTLAGAYWSEHSVRYAEIVAKASALAQKSWCATSQKLLEVEAAPAKSPAPQVEQTSRSVASIVSATPAARAVQPLKREADTVEPTMALPPALELKKPAAPAAPPDLSSIAAPAASGAVELLATDLPLAPSIPVAEEKNRPIKVAAKVRSQELDGEQPLQPARAPTVGEPASLEVSATVSIDPTSNAPVIRSTWSDRMMQLPAAAAPKEDASFPGVH